MGFTLEPLPQSQREVAERLRLATHDCDGCGDKLAPVKPVRSARNPLFLRFLCQSCFDGGIAVQFVAEAQ